MSLYLLFACWFYLNINVINVSKSDSYDCSSDDCTIQYVFPTGSNDFMCDYEGECDGLVIYTAGTLVVNCYSLNACQNVNIYCGAFDPGAPHSMLAPNADCLMNCFDESGNTCINAKLSCKGDTVTRCDMMNFGANINILSSTLECDIGSTGSCTLDCLQGECFDSNLLCHTGSSCTCDGCSPTEATITFITDTPTGAPTNIPTCTTTVPTTSDPTTANPTTFHPTSDPTKYPTSDPSSDPTYNPTFDPTNSPTFHPSKHPTSDPTNSPTSDPSPEPTYNPTFDPTETPSKAPTKYPSKAPSNNDIDGEVVAGASTTISNTAFITNDDSKSATKSWIDQLSDLSEAVFIGLVASILVLCFSILVLLLFCKNRRKQKKKLNEISINKEMELTMMSMVSMSESVGHVSKMTNIGSETGTETCTETKKETTNEMRIWLQNIGLIEYYDLFIEKGFGNQMSALQTLTDGDLMTLGIAKLEHRKVIMQHFQSDINEGGYDQNEQYSDDENDDLFVFTAEKTIGQTLETDDDEDEDELYQNYQQSTTTM